MTENNEKLAVGATAIGLTLLFSTILGAGLYKAGFSDAKKSEKDKSAIEKVRAEYEIARHYTKAAVSKEDPALELRACAALQSAKDVMTASELSNVQVGITADRFTKLEQVNRCELD